nr:ATP-dependent endonuclease [Methylovulum psychrotolerans]
MGIRVKITKIKIENFRLLKSFVLDLEDDLSLIIGKNNTGKTSILTALDKFLDSPDKKKITFDDFNVDFKKQLANILKGDEPICSENCYVPLGIRVRIYIVYDAKDDLSSVRQLIMGLDPDDNNIILGFDYEISYSGLVDMKNCFIDTKTKYKNDAYKFLLENQQDYFYSIKRKSIAYYDPSIYTDLNKAKISLEDVLSFNYISAKRSVTNKDNDKTLSTQTSRIYKKTSESPEQLIVVDGFKQKLRETDTDLSDIYEKMFNSLLSKVSKFGGMEQSDTAIKISSTLQHRELLDGNATVLYTHNTHELPENYNGLGYMNLISMIFEIEVLMTEFKRSSKEKPAAINLLFIEEPEAHTHPQMQYVFIKNIKSLLKESRIREDGIEVQLQTAITTHSSHIVAECDFDDIKYLKRGLGANSVESKNLKSLKDEYTSVDPVEDVKYKQYFKFLKQYLTLNRAELFFADKAIFIEGDTERLLLPAMMKKIDQEYLGNLDIPLLSQNISIVEVGAHSQTFEKFIDFIDVKLLIVTDIDSYYEENSLKEDGTPDTKKNGNPKTKDVACTPDNPKAQKTSNQSLLFFYNKKRGDLSYFVQLSPKNKALSKKSGEWQPDANGALFLAFQTKEDGYYGRSFEDAFFSINKSLLGQDADAYPSLTKMWFDKYVKDEIDAFDFAEKAVNSKPSLAIEILLNSNSTNGKEFSNWKIPSYIKEGLEWLRKN